MFSGSGNVTEGKIAFINFTRSYADKDCAFLLPRQSRTALTGGTVIATVLSALDFANALKNLQSNIAFCLSHRSLP
jgi:hypothetical protein